MGASPRLEPFIPGGVCHHHGIPSACRFLIGCLKPLCYRPLSRNERSGGNLTSMRMLWTLYGLFAQSEDAETGGDGAVKPKKNRFMFAVAVTGIFCIAGLRQAAAADWSGCYIGATAGVGLGNAETTDLPFVEGPFAGTGASWNSAGAPYETISSDGSGLTGGVTGGCDVEAALDTATLVFGVAADISAAGISANGQSALSSDTHVDMDVDWTATLRARAGIAVGDALFFASGGLAAADMTLRASDLSTTPSTGTMDVSQSGWQGGWVVGAGVEWRLNERWSASLEYQHMEFDGVTATGAAIDPVGAVPRFEGDLDLDIVRLGLLLRL